MMETETLSIHTVEPVQTPPASRIELRELAAVLGARRRLIGGLTVAGAVIATVVAFVLPDTYTASTIIMAPQQNQSILSTLAGQFTGMSSFNAKDLGLKNPADLYVGILGSRTISDQIIDKFNLRQQYKKDTLVETRKKLEGYTTIEAGKDTLIKISVEDPNPKQAADMANMYVSCLHAANSRLALTESGQRRLFFESQLDAEKKAIAESEATLKATQERTGVLQISGQVEVSIRSIAQVRAEIAAREVILQRLRSGATDENPEVVRQQAELKALRAQLAGLQANRPKGDPGDPVIPTGNVPAASLEYIRTLRDLKYHETLFELLAKQYEAARIDEAKQAPVIQVVDLATAPDKRTGPPRTVIIVLGGLGCFLLASAVVLAQRSLVRP